MKRKIVLRLSMLTVLLTFLWSCRQELLQTGQDYSLQSQESTIQQLVRAQLEKKDPQLLSKIEKLSAKKSSANGKIYTDAENGFSIDTDKAIFVEDANGNKTYTFKIERNNESSGFLENLVLKQIGNSEYMAYISKYDRLAVEDLGSIAPNDLKNHITFTPLGTKTGAEIFGKQQYEDPASCLILLPGNLSYIYVAGALCYTAEHDYTHIYNCNYLATGQQGPTAGYYTWEISYDTVNMCTGLPQGNTTGGSSIPIHGSIGDTDIPDLEDPCEKLKNNLQKAKTLIEQTDVKNKNDAIKANIVTDTFEKAFYWGKDAAGAVKTSSVVDGTSTTVTLSISGSQFTPEAYIHNHPGATNGYTNFSSQDINKFYDYHAGFSTITQNYANGANGSLYVMTLENQADFNDFITQYPNSSIDENYDWKDGTDIRDDEDNVLQYFIKQGKTVDEAMDLTLGYLIKKYNMGIMISKKGTDGKFHPIQVELLADPIFGTPYAYIQVNPCNL